MLFRLENPQALWGLIVLLLLAARFYWKKLKLKDSFDMKRALLSLFALFFCILGLSRLQGGDQVSTQVSSSANLYIAIDVSQSMLALDTPPSRMSFATSFAQKLLENMSSLKVAIYPFALDGYLLMPLSADLNAAKDLLSSINPSITTGQGSHLGNALSTLYQQILKTERISRERGSEWVTPQILFLSDGESHFPIEENILHDFRKSQIPIFTVTIGKDKPVSIQIENRFGAKEKLRDSGGKLVTTSANFENMRKIASLTQGYSYTDSFEEVYTLSRRLKQSLQIGKLSTTFRLQKEFYPYFFLMSFFLLFVLFGMGRWEYALRATIAIFLIAPPLYGAEPYENEALAVENYNQGVRFLENNDLKSAADKFEQSTLGSLDPNLRKRALFNLGNTHLKLGDPAQAISAYQQAYDTEGSTSKFNQEANQKISDNLALASRVEEMMKKKATEQSPGEGGSGEDKPEGKGSDPKGPKQFEAQPLTDSMKQKVYDLISNDERQTLQRLNDEKNRKSNLRTEKPW